MKYCNTGIINCKDCWDWDKDRCKVGLHNPNDKVAIAIAARDKWWITQMESKFFAAIGCRLFPDNCDSCSIIERCTALGWQRFKSTLEVM